MPVAESAPAARQAALVGVGAAVGIVAVIFLVVQMDRLLDRSGDVSFGLGDTTSTFQPGKAEDLAGTIGSDGPLLFGDPTGGDRDIWVNHVGDTDTEGWRAFAARQPASPRHCYVEWAADDLSFVDNCDGTTYPPSGDGLPQYPVSVGGDGDLSVDLRSPASSEPSPDQGG